MSDKTPGRELVNLSERSLIRKDESGRKKTQGGGRLVDRLSERTIAALMRKGKKGRFPDGAGLYLQLQGKPSDAASWVHLYRHGDGQRSMMGLGPYPLRSLAEARRARDENLRKLRLDGVDPMTERAVRRAAVKGTGMTFRDAAEQYIAEHEGAWKGEEHAATWRTSLLGSDTVNYCKPIADLPVASIDSAAVLSVLKPIWQTRNATAAKLRGRIEAVLGWAAINGRRPKGDNPARWGGLLEHALPAPAKVAPVTNRAALPYAEVPAFVRALRKRQGVGALALELVILTAVRAGEALGARVGEFDLKAQTWTIPAGRMKGGREHAVPLSARAAAIVAAASEGKADGDLLFPGAGGDQLSDATLLAVLARMRVKATVHGFRSSFRDWAGNETRFPRELAEHALSHRIGDAAEQAYRRSTALMRRKPLMNAWATFVDGAETAKVIPMHA